MPSICQICLSTDRKVQSLDESLEFLHNEICDYDVEEIPLYCMECAYLLKKYYDFKQRCVQSHIILQKWKKNPKKIRLQLINNLKNELSPSPLGFSNIKNRKFFSNQLTTETDYKTYNNCHFYTRIEYLKDTNNTSEFFIENVTCDQTDNPISTPCNRILAYNDNTDQISFIETVSFKMDNQDTDNKEDVSLNIDSVNENEIIKETEIKVELSPTHEENDLDIIDEGYTYNSDVDNENDEKDTKVVSIKKLDDNKCSDSSDDEVLMKKTKKVSVIKSRQLSKLSIKSIMEQIRSKIGPLFENNEIKDKDGNVINKDIILDNLNNLSSYTLTKVKRICLGTGPLTPENIEILSRIQKTHTDPCDYDVKYFNTNEEIITEFKKRQQSENYLKSDYKCKLCYRGFKFKKLLDYHSAERHNPNSPFFCSLCSVRFKSKSARRNHMKMHKAEFKCKLCPFVTNVSDLIKSHCNVHNGVLIKCQLCGRLCKSKSGLAFHMNYTHPSKFLSCPYCARSFHTRLGLTQHKDLKHATAQIDEGQGVKCDPCNIIFVTDKVYQKHFRKCHLETEKSKSTVRCKYGRRLKSNSVRKTAEYVCRVCAVVEKSIGDLIYHFKTTHPSENCESLPMVARQYKYLCQECGKGFMTITNLNEHKNIHTGAKPYACDMCPKAFYRRLNLRMHKERHLPPKRECPHCGKMFKSHANLNNHLRVHKGQRRYICEHCSKGFLHSSSLTAHIRGVHQHIRRTRKSKDQES